MGGAAPSNLFYWGMILAPVVAGFFVSILDWLRHYRKQNLWGKLFYFSLGVLLTTLIWMPLTMDLDAAHILALLDDEKAIHILTFFAGLSVMPWLVFGNIVRYAIRDACVYRGRKSAFEKDLDRNSNDIIGGVRRKFENPDTEPE